MRPSIDSARGRTAVLLLALLLLAGLTAGCGKNGTENAVASPAAESAEPSSEASAEADESAEESDSADAAAVYKGGFVTQEEFALYKAFLKIIYFQYGDALEQPDLQETIVRQLLAARLMSEGASDEAKTKGKQDADQQLSLLKQVAGFSEDSLKEMDQVMKDSGLTYERIGQFLQELYIASAGVAQRLTDADIANYYGEHKADYQTVSVRHILIGLTDKDGNARSDRDALKLALQIQSKLEAGGDWDSLAKTYSDDAGSAYGGGLYEDADPNQWVEAFKQAAVTLPIGKIGNPVKTDYGYHVMKVEARQEKTLEESKEGIRKQLVDNAFDKFMSDELPGLIRKLNVQPAASSGGTSSAPSASPAPSMSSSAIDKFFGKRP